MKGFLNVNAKRPSWASKVPRFIWFVFTCLFGLLMEEVAMAIEYINPSKKIIKLEQSQQDSGTQEESTYLSLTDEDRHTVKQFYKVREKTDNLSTKMIHLESSVQLVFYLTLLLVNFNETPVMELNYNERSLNLASTKWILGLIWFLLKTLLSGFTTFSSIFMTLKRDSYRSTRAAPGIIQYVFVVLGVLIDLMFSASTCFL